MASARRRWNSLLIRVSRESSKGLHLIVRRTIGLTSYIVSLTPTLTLIILVRSSVIPIVQYINECNGRLPGCCRGRWNSLLMLSWSLEQPSHACLTGVLLSGVLVVCSTLFHFDYDWFLRRFQRRLWTQQACHRRKTHLTGHPVSYLF